MTKSFIAQHSVQTLHSTGRCQYPTTNSAPFCSLFYCWSIIMQNRSKIFWKRPLPHLKFYYGHAWLVNQLLKTSSSESALLPPTHEIVHVVSLNPLPLPPGISQKNPTQITTATSVKEWNNSLNLFHFIVYLTHEAYPLKLVLYNNLHYTSAFY